MFCQPRRCGKLAVEYVRPTEVVHCAVYSRKLGSETFGATSSEDYADIFWGVFYVLRICYQFGIIWFSHLVDGQVQVKGLSSRCPIRGHDCPYLVTIKLIVKNQPWSRGFSLSPNKLVVCHRGLSLGFKVFSLSIVVVVTEFCSCVLIYY